LVCCVGLVFGASLIHKVLSFLRGVPRNTRFPRSLVCQTERSAKCPGGLASLAAAGTLLTVGIVIIKRRITMAEPTAQAYEWQPIETAPNDKWVLVYCPWISEYALAIHRTGNRRKTGWQVQFLNGERTYINRSPSHWMHIPLPPL
jgi:hypothetical protein